MVPGRAAQLLDEFLRNFWTIQDRIRLAARSSGAPYPDWGETSTTLTPLAEGADLLFTGQYLEESAANVAEYYDIPLATLHHYPDTGQRPARSEPAVAVDPLHHDGERVAAVSAHVRRRPRTRNAVNLACRRQQVPRRDG